MTSTWRSRRALWGALACITALAGAAQAQSIGTGTGGGSGSGSGSGNGSGSGLAWPRTNFGLYRAQTANIDTAAVRYLGTEWSFRMLKPYFSFGWWYDSDAGVTSTCGAGLQLAFTITTAADDSTNAYYPVDMQAWTDSITRIVERYDGDGHDDMPFSSCVVHHWHIEQEDTFWKGTEDQYVDYYTQTRAAILAADSTAQVGLIGLSSDLCWNAAYQAGFVHGRPPSNRYYAPARLQQWINRTTRYLSTLDYDFVDLHSYQVDQTIQGELAYLRSLMADSTKEIWCYEAGGPNLSRAEGYTDTLNAYHVMSDYAEALGNGVVCYAFEYLPPGPYNQDLSEKWTNVALVHSDNQSYVDGKPSYETYRLLTQKLADYTSATDNSIRDYADEDSCLFDIRFETEHGPVDVVWCPLQTRPFTLETTASRVVITHPITVAGQRAEDALIETVPSTDGVVTILVGPEPVFIENGAGTISEVEGGLGPGDAPRPVRLSLAPSPARAVARFRAQDMAPGGTLGLELLDVTGRVMQRLTLRADATTGTATAAWDLRDRAGHRVPAGIYYARPAGGAGPVIRVPVLP